VKETFMKTVVGLFDTHAHAEAAAHALERAGISHEDISLIANNASGQLNMAEAAPTEKTSLADAEAETGKGAVVGGVAGLLLGLAALAIPGLGIIAAAGWLTTMVTGALVGAGVGLVGALNGAGIPHEEAAYYTEGVRRGGTLLAARVQDDRTDEIAQMLSANGAVNINERAAQYRQEGFVPAVPTADAASAVVPVETATAPGPTPPTPPLPAKREAPASKRKSAQAQMQATAAVPAVAMDTTEREGEMTSPLMEAGLDAGKGEIESGARVYSQGTERPVEEVPPRAEPVSMERPATGQPTSGAALPGTRDDLKPQVRIRAYELYEQRGRGDGLALQDWLTAEREIGSKLAQQTG
jgi:hypothetical protein